MVNVKKLKGKIIECGFTVEGIAKEMGVNKSTLYRKLNDKADNFTIGETNAIKGILNLSPQEAIEIFLA